MHIILGILLGVFLVMCVLQLAWMGITWAWAVGFVRGLHIPVSAMVAAFFIFRLVNVIFKRIWFSTLCALVASLFVSWWVLVNFFYFGHPEFRNITAKHLFGRRGTEMSPEASIILVYCIAFVATLITISRARRASLTPEQLEEKRAKVLSSAKSFGDTLVLFTYGEYIRGGKQIDIVFVILPLAGVVATLIGIWFWIAG